MDLGGKRIVVTGTTRGLGYALARVLVSCNARVFGVGRSAVTGRTLEAQLNAGPGQFRFYEADLSRAGACETLCRRIIDEQGGADVVINNAGVNAVRRLVDITDDDWDWIVDTNLKAPFQISRGFLPSMMTQGGGTLIHIASINAVYGMANMAPYNASKAGLVHLSRTIAVEYAQANIASIAIILGGVASEMNVDIAQQMYDLAKASGQNLVGPRPTQGRGYTPEMAAKALVLLCTDQARLYNGAVISLDGAASAGLLASMAIYAM